MKNSEYIGQTFGLWTVLAIAPNKVSPSGTSRAAFTCQCVCGKIKDVAKTELIRGRSTNCGCRGVFLKPGDKYQEWTVLKKSEYTNAHKSQFYDCQCSCGVIRAVRMSDLTNGKSNNCGHNRYTLSKGAQMIKDKLDEIKQPYYMEYVFSDLLNRRYDFALYNKEDPTKIIRLIEFDGQQHSKTSTSSWSGPEVWKRDEEKNTYAINNNIPLIRIPWYKKIITEEELFGERFLVRKEDIDAQPVC